MAISYPQVNSNGNGKSPFQTEDTSFKWLFFHGPIGFRGLQPYKSLQPKKNLPRPPGLSTSLPSRDYGSSRLQTLPAAKQMVQSTG